MKTIAIIGAGGHTRSSLNLLKQHFTDAIFKIYDDSYVADKKETIRGIDLVGTIEDINKDEMIFLSIGDNKKREEQFQLFYNQLVMDNLIHSTIFMENHIRMGVANQIYANVYINAYSKIGDNNIINTSATLEHEVEVGSHNHISVGAKLCGRVKVGNFCYIGAGTIIIDKLLICDNVTVGAGSVVIKNITEPGTYVGNPARKIK